MPRDQGGRLLAKLLRRLCRPDREPGLTAADVERVTPLLLGTGGGALGWALLRGTSLAEEPAAQRLRQAYRYHTLQAAIKERDLVQVLEVFRAQGIEPVLVKGWNAARRYPERGLRPYGDFDFCVLPDQETRALQAVLAARGEFSIDLHVGYPKLLDRTPEELFRRAAPVPVGDTQVLVPCEEDHLRLLCLHLLQHGAWRPLWLCDIALVLSSLPPEFDWDLCLGKEPCHVDWVLTALALAAALLEADAVGTPVQARLETLPGWVLPAVYRQWEAAKEGVPWGELTGALRSARSPRELMDAVRPYWRNPIQATVELGIPFNAVPRLPLQLAATLRRAPSLASQLGRGRIKKAAAAERQADCENQD